MKVGARRTIFWSFVIIFFITSFFVLFYGSGYYIDFTNKKINKTGMFFVRPKTKDANLFIDEKFITNSFPANLRLLKPKTYKVELKKDDYVAWSKNLEIKPNETTFITDVALFLNPKLTLDPLTTHEDLIKMFASQNNDRRKLPQKYLLAKNFRICDKQNVAIIFNDSHTITLISTEKNGDDAIRETTLTRSSEEIKDVECLENLPYIVSGMKQTIKIIETDTRDEINTVNIEVENLSAPIVVTKQGKQIKFYANIKGVEGVYNLNLFE